MPKNKGKGGKNRRRGKNEGDGMKRELIRKDGDDQGKLKILDEIKFCNFQSMHKFKKCLVTADCKLNVLMARIVCVIFVERCARRSGSIWEILS